MRLSYLSLSQLCQVALVLFILNADNLCAGVHRWHCHKRVSTVNSLAVHPETPNVLYAGTTAGLFKSIDGGIGWNAIHSGLPDLRINTLAIDPHTPTTLYVAIAARAQIAVGGGVFKSTDAGMTWRAINDGLFWEGGRARYNVPLL